MRESNEAQGGHDLARVALLSAVHIVVFLQFKVMNQIALF